MSFIDYEEDLGVFGHFFPLRENRDLGVYNSRFRDLLFSRKAETDGPMIIKTLAGNIDLQPEGGEVSINGTPITGGTEGISYVPGTGILIVPPTGSILLDPAGTNWVRIPSNEANVQTVVGDMKAHAYYSSVTWAAGIIGENTALGRRLIAVCYETGGNTLASIGGEADTVEIGNFKTTSPANVTILGGRNFNINHSTGQILSTVQGQDYITLYKSLIQSGGKNIGLDTDHWVNLYIGGLIKANAALDIQTETGDIDLSPGSGQVEINGGCNITGTLSKGGGTFLIDHPSDPENKYLRHSFVESPDMKNVYDGIAVCDEKGEAIVELPDYFCDLNKDFRYQLTCIGKYAMVYIDQEIEKNLFKIAGGVPDLKVSWQVTGIRKDAYAEKYAIVTETDKAPEDKGKYLYPEAFGEPNDLRIKKAK